MKELFEKLVKDKEEIVMEEVKTVKMLVPVSFELKDGKCADDETQALYDFLTERPDVTEEEVAEVPAVENNDYNYQG